MNIGNVVLAVVAIAVMVVGVIEWFKGWWKKIPSWFPSVASPVFCLVLGQVVAPLVLLGTLTWLWGIVLGLMGLAVTELCYQILVQSIPQVVQAVLSNAVGSAVPPKPPA